MSEPQAPERSAAIDADFSDLNSVISDSDDCVNAAVFQVSSAVSQLSCKNKSHCFLSIKLWVDSVWVSSSGMIDSGASGNFMDISFAQKHGIRSVKKATPLQMETVDGSLLTSGPVDQETEPLKVLMEEHHRHVRMVLERLRQNHLYIKLEKCEFHRTEIQFLGYVMSTQGISMDGSKTQAIKNWPVPKNVKEVQRFIGFANFYRRFIRNFSEVVSPITQLTRKASSFTWTPQAQEAFSSLKDKFTTAPILVHPNPELAFIIEVDASDCAIGAILSQRTGEKNVLHPCAFFSQRLSAAERNYDVGNRELLAIIAAFKEWRHLLQGAAQQIVVLTDHRNLEFIRSAKCLTPRQARWNLFLNQFNFIISYRPGSHNGKADALSRIHSTETRPPTPPKTILPDSRFLGVIHNQDLLKDIKEAYHADSLLAQPPRDTNGQTERTNQTLEQYLRCFICHLQDDWVDLLPLAEFSYNNSQSASTKQSPFYANLGYHPNILPQFPIDTPLPAVAERITSLQRNIDLLKENLQLAQERYKRAADKFRKPAPAFKVGDLVWLSTKNLKLRIPSSKLGHKYIGPYKISRIVSAVACRLQLPGTMKIHPVFHVSLLKAAVPNTFPGRSSPHPDPVLIDAKMHMVTADIPVEIIKVIAKPMGIQ
ncbi:uncharacterized protein LOC143803164 [Ranitomeya variabilis]|uniref:uncharacterized protein LOC143803164 n=1 Tax=Ranitomeya variabilis TaxID=490064 RepID=UPI004057C58F